VTLVLGLDIGSTTTKAALVSVTDAVSVLRVARTPTPSTPSDLVAAAAAVVRECVADAGTPIAAVGIASMAESGAALGSDGRALTPLLRWDRSVSARHLDSLLSRHPDLPARTGVPATTKPAAVALTALRAEDPSAFARMRHWSGVADLVAHALTGERATDHTLAARTMMAGSHGEAWDAEVLEITGIRPGVLPELRAPGDAVAVTSDEARAFGLGRGVPVYIAGHDHAVGAWAVGVREPGAVADSLGTAEAVVRVTAAPGAGGSGVDPIPSFVAAAVADGFSVGRTVDGAARTILGGSRACGAMLEWWDAEHPGDRVFTRLAGLGSGSWPATGMIVLPYPSGRQCPSPDPHARVVVRGDADDGEARARGLLQSLVFHARWMRETIDALAGDPASEVTLLGSLAERIRAWAPLTAAAGVPTHVATSGEPVAAGAALLAAVRRGEASPRLSLARARVAPADAPDLDDTYRRFLRTVTAEGER
jgi:xylulokinase